MKQALIKNGLLAFDIFFANNFYIFESTLNALLIQGYIPRFPPLTAYPSNQLILKAFGGHNVLAFYAQYEMNPQSVFVNAIFGVRVRFIIYL